MAKFIGLGGPPPQPHYEIPIQPWDYIASNKLDFFEGNVVKYITRWRSKDGVEDLLKARHYIDKLIELNENREQNRISKPNLS